MNFDFYKKLVDEAAILDVPSIKLKKQGEPLLNPKLEEFITYAKKKEFRSFINTNAVSLLKKERKN